jgi:hypothetical protein
MKEKAKALTVKWSTEKQTLRNCFNFNEIVTDRPFFRKTPVRKSTFVVFALFLLKNCDIWLFQKQKRTR